MPATLTTITWEPAWPEPAQRADEEQAMHIEHFFDPNTSTLTYVVLDEQTSDAIVIDPVLDFDPAADQTSTASVERVEAFLRSRGARVRMLLETHAHADHLSASQYLRRRFGAPLAIGTHITDVQATFRELFDLGTALAVDGSQFDRLIADGERVEAGSIVIDAIATPGHTPACLSYRIGDAVFTGDALFIEDYGTGRCDFPGGSARALYHSVHDRLYALPPETRVFPCHDYQPGGRPLRWESSIGAELRGNVQLREDTTEESFVALRTARDATLSTPKLLFPSVQVNIDGGRLPRPLASGRRHLATPINLFAPSDDDGSRPSAR